MPIFDEPENKNEVLVNASVTAAILFEKLKKDALDGHIDLLPKHEEEILEAVLKWVKRLSKHQEGTAIFLLTYRTALRAIGNLVDDLYTEQQNLYTEGFDEVVDHEQERLDIYGVVAGSAFVITAVTAASVLANNKVFGQDVKLAWRTASDRKKTELMRVLNNSRRNGDTIAEITREIVRISRQTVNHISTTVLTGLQDLSSQLVDRTLRLSGRLGLRYVYIAVIDDRTTVICNSLHQQTFRYGQGPLPPQHHNCRSTTSLVLPRIPLPVIPRFRLDDLSLAS